jgi:hypothetical protein
MDAGHVTPIPPPSDPSRAWLVLQHNRDLQTIDAQADLIASLEARCAKYAFDQAALIVEGNREAHKR